MGPSKQSFHGISIPNMPKPSKRVVNRLETETLWNRYDHAHDRLVDIELELANIMGECPSKTSCYLRWGPWCNDYAAGGPHKGSIRTVDDENGGHHLEYEGIEEWQIVLADFYAQQATKLVREREQVLKQMCAYASAIYETRQTTLFSSVILSSFKKTRVL